MVDDFGSVKRQFGGLGGGDAGDESRGGDLGRVGGEDAVYFFPDLELGGFEAYRCERGAEISVASPDIAIEERSRDIAEEAG